MLFDAIGDAPEPYNSRNGSASGFGTPDEFKEGPIARTRTCFGLAPVMMKPPMPTLSPVPTRIRVERFRAWLGVGVGLAVGVAVALAVAVGVEVGVDVAVAVALGVEVAVAVAVAVGVGEAGIATVCVILSVLKADKVSDW